MTKLVTGTVLAAGLVLGGAIVPSTAQASACGFYVAPRTGWAYYRHCIQGVYTRVRVKVETRRGPGSYICVKPGTVGLGPSSVVKFAYYTGKLC
ncbi:DUF6355 family natural product biosynthesis protein [Chamaesiphon polymorphus]|nr:DUF6355 family natural product biosynthesis protein [Chamaesiphon polymorphus]